MFSRRMAVQMDAQKANLGCALDELSRPSILLIGELTAAF